MKWVRCVVALAALAVAVVVAVSLLRGADTPSPPKLPDARQDRGDGPVDGTLAPTAGSYVGYEETLLTNGEAELTARPDPGLRAWVDAARARWEGKGGGDTMGFALLTRRRTATAH